MHKTKVKVCGVTLPNQAHELSMLGVDAIGMILKAESPRLVSSKTAQEISRSVAPFTSVVGVFVDASIEEINRAVEEIGLNYVQLHGNEAPEISLHINVPCIRAIRAKSKEVVIETIHKNPSACAYLIDPYVEGVAGGTGKTLDYSLWPDLSKLQVSTPLILAGGLSPANLQGAISELSPFAVDLNSGVEQSPGIKDMNKVAAALRLVQRFNES